MKNLFCLFLSALIAAAAARAQNVNVMADSTTGDLWRPSTFFTNAANAAEMSTGLGLVPIATSGSASHLSTGTVPDARFPSTLPALSGVNLTALNATQLTSGTLPAARLPALTGDVTSAVGSAATTVITASTSQAGKVELATSDEAIASTDSSRAVTTAAVEARDVSRDYRALRATVTQSVDRKSVV